LEDRPASPALGVEVPVSSRIFLRYEVRFSDCVALCSILFLAYINGKRGVRSQERTSKLRFQPWQKRIKLEIFYGVKDILWLDCLL
jgi:hypothetical protein